MRAPLNNPFVIGGYISPEYFCNRENESAQLLGAISSRRNTTLISLRRMGKTGLLKHISHIMEEKKQKPEVVFIDLLPTMNANEMLNLLATSLIRIKSGEKNILEKVMGLLAKLRPVFSYDSLTGQPTLQLTIGNANEVQLCFGSLLDFAKDVHSDVVIIFDEFQQILNYPEKNTENILRTVIQANPSLSFIFSGSSKHMLEPMFMSAKRPFYQSAEILYLDAIHEKEYSSFILNLFSSGGRKISSNLVSRILEFSRGHTYYVQYVCNKLFEAGNEIIDEEKVNQVFFQVLTSFEPMFVNYRNLLPSHQFKLLKAIAIENGVEKITASVFISKHNLTSPSSVVTSVKALSEKEMIIKTNNEWQVYDVFFSRWLEYHYK